MKINNPFPEYIVDEASGIKVKSQRYEDFEDGKKAGYKEGLRQGYADNRDEKKAGIREVVEWIEKDRYEVNQKNVPALGIIPLSLIHLERWQTKLKDWGIK